MRIIQLRWRKLLNLQNINENQSITEQIFEKYFDILSENKEIDEEMVEGLRELRKNKNLDDLEAIKSVLSPKLGGSDENT